MPDISRNLNIRIHHLMQLASEFLPKHGGRGKLALLTYLPAVSLLSNYGLIMNRGSYNSKLQAAKRRIFQTLKKDGIEVNGIKHRKLISLYFNKFDIQRPIELRWQDLIIKLYENGDLGKLEPTKRTPKGEISQRKQEYLDLQQIKHYTTNYERKCKEYADLFAQYSALKTENKNLTENYHNRLLDIDELQRTIKELRLKLSEFKGLFSDNGEVVED